MPWGRDIPWLTLLVLGFVLTGLLFSGTYHAEHRRLEEEFRNRSQERARAIEHALRNNVAALELVAGLLPAMRNLEASEFQVVARDLRQNRPEVLKLEWIAVVPAAQQHDLRERLSQEPLLPLGSASLPTLAPASELALPVVFAEPGDPASPQAQTDYRQDAQRWPALERAWESGAVSLSWRELAPSEPSAGHDRTRTVSELLVPVFPLPPPDSSTEGNAQPVGFLGMTVDNHRLIEQALASLEPAGVHVALQVALAPERPRVRVGYHTSRLDHTGTPEAGRQAVGGRATLHHHHPFEAAGLQWEVECQPAPALTSRFNHVQSWALLAAGVVITLLGSIYLRLVAHRASLTPRQVEERTLEYKTANTMLRQEIRRRTDAVLALQAAEARYRDMFEQSPHGIFRANTEGRLLVANPAFARICGFSSVEEMKRGVSFLPDKVFLGSAEWRGLLSELHQTGILTGREMRLRRADGTIAWVSASLRLLIDAQDGLPEIEGTLLDITQRKQAEEEKQWLEARLRQSQKMESLGTLAGGIAHDFNNILTAIIGYAELLSQESSADVRRKKKLDGILMGAFRARDLVRQILTFSCAQITERVPVRLSGVVSEALHLLRSALPPTIRIEFPQTEAPGHVLADLSQIHQVIMNLGTNAAQAMPQQHGTLTLALQEVELLREPALRLGVAAGSYLALTVADNGEGIDPKVVHRIFEPFFTTKPVGQGTGLGLSVVHGILQGHGGTITVESEVGRGTTFRMYFPQIPAPEQEQPVPAAVFLPGNDESILLVDDEAHVVRVLEEGLKRLGYRVTAFESSREAWETFTARSRDFDLLITDQAMPEISGLQLISQIRLLNADLPAILCTASPPCVSKEELRQIGRCHLISKPVELVELSQTIRRVLVRASLTEEGQGWDTAMLGEVA